MSAFGPKRTSLVALHMSAFGGKADMTLCGNLLSRSLLGVKRTCRFAMQMSAFDPKRTWKVIVSITVIMLLTASARLGTKAALHRSPWKPTTYAKIQSA